MAVLWTNEKKPANLVEYHLTTAVEIFKISSILLLFPSKEMSFVSFSTVVLLLEVWRKLQTPPIPPQNHNAKSLQQPLLKLGCLGLKFWPKFPKSRGEFHVQSTTRGFLGASPTLGTDSLYVQGLLCPLPQMWEKG